MESGPRWSRQKTPQGEKAETWPSADNGLLILKKMGEFLFITTKVDWGGSEPLWCEAASKALEEGHRVTVLLPQVGKLARPVEELDAKGAKVVMRPPRARPTLLRRLEWKVKGIREPETQWWRTHFPEPFDAICVSQGGAYCVMNMPGLANWLLEIDTPFVLVGHSHRPFAMPAGELRETIRRLFDKADKVCLVAQDHVRAVGRFLGMELRNAVVVQNPVNLEEEKEKTDLTTENMEFTEVARLRLASQAGASETDSLASELAESPVSESLIRSADGPALAAEPPEENAEKLKLEKAETRNALDAGRSTLDSTAPEARMACVARFEVRDKGQDLLLEALADPVWRARDFRLDFFGSGPDREILEDLISFYGLGDKVRIVGFESDIRKIWKEHHLLVLPSLSEGTPISLIEAQLCGRAALVTRVDGNPEWVEEGKTGFLAEAPTVHHLRLALERAWENRYRWEEMGEAARAACLAKRDPDPAGTLLRLLEAAAEA